MKRVWGGRIVFFLGNHIPLVVDRSCYKPCEKDIWPEPEALLGVSGPEGTQHHGAHSHQEDQHSRVVKVYVISKI